MLRIPRRGTGLSFWPAPGGLRWQLMVVPHRIDSENNNSPVTGVFLYLLDCVAVPVQLAEATFCVRGFEDSTLSPSGNRFSTGDDRDNGTDAYENDVLESESESDDKEEDDGRGGGDDDEDDAEYVSSSNAGFTWTHSDLVNNAAMVLAGGQLVISVTLRFRSFSDLAVPRPLAPTLPALVAAALPVSGAAALADGVDVVFKAADGERIGAHSFILALRSSVLRTSLWGPLAPTGAASSSQPRVLDCMRKRITAAQSLSLC